MINTEDLYIVNYCHSNCEPLKNIMRLSKKESFELAYQMAISNPNTTAFYRFADSENYYPRRMKVDKLLYDTFVSLGGTPKSKHPLSFVFHGSDYLNEWFNNGIITRIPLVDIPSEYVSFTYGDSMADLQRRGNISIFTKEMLLESICNYKGSFDDYMQEIVEKHYYIEVQLWNDDYSKIK